MNSMTETMVVTNGVRLKVAAGGEGEPIVLLHGFPHTWKVWNAIIPTLIRDHRVIAPDLRGLGGSERALSGYDSRNIALDVVGLLDHFGEQSATVIAIDAGVSPAFILGLEHPDRVSRLVLIEGVIGQLPGAEEFFSGGAPWWFGFHSVPDLAEDVLIGNEGAYIDFFLRMGMSAGRSIPEEIRTDFVTAYTGKDSLRAAFEYYRAMPVSSQQITEASSHARLIPPTIAIGGRVVGDATAKQLSFVSETLTSHLLPTAGHIVPLDAPTELLAILANQVLPTTGR